MTSLNVLASRGIRTGAMAVIIAASLSVSGCSGGSPGQDGTSPPSSTDLATTSAPPTPTPTPSAVYKPADASGPAQNVPVPVLPEVAKTETKEGLEAFTQYWYSTLSYAYETGDLGPLDEVTGPNCSNCEAAKKIITNWFSDGGWLAGGKVVTPATETNYKVALDGNLQVIVQVQQSELRAYRPDGSAADTVVPATDSAQIFLAQYSSSGWKLTDAQRLNG